MAREYKKGVYTLKEISELAMKKYPDRWVNLDSAYASVKTAARQLAINDINGKRKYKQIAAVEVARIFEILEKCNRRKKSGPKQADLFSLLPAQELHVDELIETNDTAAQIIKTTTAQQKTAESFEELTLAAQELGRAFLNFALACRSYNGEV